MWDDPRIDLAWLWVGVGGSEGRMGGLSQAAQTMSLVTSESGCAPLLDASSAKTRGVHTQLDEGPETP